VVCGAADPRDLRSFPTRRSSDLLYCESGDHRGLHRLIHETSVPEAGLRFFTENHGDSERFRAIPGRFADNYAAPGRLPGREIERSEEHTSELQSRENLVCRLLLE